MMENMEFYSDIAVYANGVADIFVTAYLFRCFIKPFLPKIRYGNCIGMTYIVVMSILKFIPCEMDAMAAYAAGMAAALAAMYLVDRRDPGQKIFLAVTFYLLEWISWEVTIMPWNFLCGLLFTYFENNFLPLFIALIVINDGMEFLVMAVLIKWIHRSYVCKKEKMTGGELMYMLAPSLALLAGYWLLRFFSNMDELAPLESVWSSRYEYKWFLVLYPAISFAAMLTVIVMYQRIKIRQREEKEEAVLSRQMEDMKNHICEVEKLYEDIRGLKHDFGNHMMILENLYGRREEAEAYAAELKSRLSKAMPERKSGNPVTDVILTEKCKEMEERGISFRCDFHYPKGRDVNAFDISVILSNAVDNAIEAAGECEAPYVSIVSCQRKNAYILEIRNSASGVRPVEEESGLPVTAKKEGGHGFGLSNIRKVARKYYGDITIDQDGKEFVLSVMLMALNE